MNMLLLISNDNLGCHYCINLLNPHYELRHHFASLKNDLISRNLAFLEQKYSWNRCKNNCIFLNFSTAASHFHPLQVENCDSNLRLVVVEYDRLERVKLSMNFIKNLPYNVEMQNK